MPRKTKSPGPVQPPRRRLEKTGEISRPDAIGSRNDNAGEAAFPERVVLPRSPGQSASPLVVIPRSEATRNPSGLSAPPAGDDSATVEGAAAIASPAGKTTLAEASRDRLAKPIADRELWSEFEKATGETVDPSAPPTWAELIAAQQARRATGEGGARDAKELRDAAEGSKNDPTRVAFLLSLDGLPRTTAVTGKRPA